MKMKSNVTGIPTRIRNLVGLFMMMIVASLTAQDAPAPVTTTDPAVSEEQLGWQVRPMTKDELVVEADAWLTLLRAKTSEISDAEIARLVNDDTAPEVANIVDLTSEQDALAKRLSVVLDQLEKKGGDPSTYEAYSESVITGLGDASLGNTEDLSRYYETLRKAVEDNGLIWIKNILMFVAVIVFFMLFSRFVGGVVNKGIGTAKKVPTLLRTFIVTACRRLVFFIGLLVAVKQVGIDVTPILALIGAAGFVIALALQGTLSNFASGLLILWKHPYDIGDVIDAGGVVGKVDSMNLFSTHIKTPDNRNMIVPNNSIWNGVITNITGSPTRRVDMVFGIGYDDSIDQAQEILERIISEHPLTLKDPAPAVKFNELADSSMNFLVRPWAKTADYWDLYWDVQKQVKQAFDKAGISIPYPQRDVHMHQVAPK